MATATASSSIYSQPWSPSVQPVPEEDIPAELKRWRRWSTHFEKDLDNPGFDINTDCSSCGDNSWDFVNLKLWIAIRCRSCGFEPKQPKTPIPEEPPQPYSPVQSPGTMYHNQYTYPDESSNVSTPSTGDTDLSTLDSIEEQDFAFRKQGQSSSSAAPAVGGPRTPAIPETFISPPHTATIASSSHMEPSSSAIRSIASPTTPSQHSDAIRPNAVEVPHHLQPPTITLADPPAPKPRLRDPAKRHSRHISSVRQSMMEPRRPMPKWFEANTNLKFKFVLTPRGKAVALPNPDSNPSGSSSSSSAAAGAAESSSTQGVSLAEFANDPTALQRLLTCAMFMLNDVPAKDAPPKRLDLGLLNSRTSGSRHFAMKHEMRGGGGGGGEGSSSASGSTSKFKAPLADEEGRIIDAPAPTFSEGSSKRIMWKISVQ